METLFRGCSTLLSKSQLGRRKKKTFWTWKAWSGPISCKRHENN